MSDVIGQCPQCAEGRLRRIYARWEDRMNALSKRTDAAEAEADRLRLKAIEDALRINNLLSEVGRLQDDLAAYYARVQRAVSLVDELIR